MRKKMIKQRLIGLIAIIIGLIYICMASRGVTLEERDITGAVMIMAIGLIPLLSKKYILGR